MRSIVFMLRPLTEPKASKGLGEMTMHQRRRLGGQHALAMGFQQPTWWRPPSRPAASRPQAEMLAAWRRPIATP